MKRKFTNVTSTLLLLLLLFSSLHDSSFVLIANAANESDSRMTASPMIIDLEEYKSNEIIITYKESVEGIPLSALIPAFIKETDVTYVTEESILVTLKTSSDLSRAITWFVHKEDVLSMQPNYTYNTSKIMEDPYLSIQWGMENRGNFKDEFNYSSTEDVDMNLTDAWDKTHGEKEVIVAVIDTGIDYNHEDLKDVIWTNTKEVPEDEIDNDDNGFVDDIHGWNFYKNSNVTYNSLDAEDHGTHVAGIIAASQNNVGIAGIASNANISIMSVKVLGGKDGSGQTSSIIKAIGYAKKMGASICNISAGTSNYDFLLELAIKNSGMLVVTAAGNGDEDGRGIDNDITPMYPSSFNLDNIISVANLRCDGILEKSSNYGWKSVDIAAPGTSIWSTLPENQYGYLTGTSMATPMVAGVAALVYSYYEDITLAQTKAIVLNSAKKLPELSGLVITSGMPDALKALSYDDASFMALGITPPTIVTKVKGLSNSYHKNLLITVTDNEDNLSKVRYAVGTQSAGYFEVGVKGTPLSLTKNVATIKVDKTTTYTIYALDDTGNETVNVVTINITKPKKITILSKKTLKVGATYTIKPKLTPAKVKTGLTYSSSKPKVATVNSKTGKITAKKKGSTTITVKTQNGLKDKCLVTVK